MTLFLSKKEEREVFELALLIIEQRYKYAINKSEDGIINWQKIIPSCKGYTHAIDMIGNSIQDAQRQKEIQLLD